MGSVGEGDAWASHIDFPRNHLIGNWTLGGERVNRSGDPSQTTVLPISDDRCTLTSTLKSPNSQTLRKAEVLVNTRRIDLNLTPRNCAEQFIRDGAVAEE